MGMVRYHWRQISVLYENPLLVTRVLYYYRVDIYWFDFYIMLKV